MPERTIYDGTGWVTIDEAAAMLRLSRRTIERYIQNDRLTAHSLPTGRVRLYRTEVEALIQPTERASA